jgi:hypothetical protein
MGADVGVRFILDHTLVLCARVNFTAGVGHVFAGALLKLRLAERREHVIALRPKGHLSIGYAFGYVFRATNGFQLWVERPIPNSNQTQWWR